MIFWTGMTRRGYILAGIYCMAVTVPAYRGAEPQIPNTLMPEEKAVGWILLFDGKTMNGWDDPRMKSPPGDAWAIDDGCLKANRNPHITEDLFTQDKFTDFELMFEWRISRGGNSGVKYRIQDHWFIAPKESGAPHERFEQSVERSFLHPVSGRPQRGQDYVIGFEYQITDDAQNGDAKGNFKHTAGALYDMAAPSSVATRRVGEFNDSRILVRGNHVEHWMNGVKVVDSALDSADALSGIQTRWGTAPHVHELLAKQPKKSCPISLQNHDNDAWFRSIKIRRLN
jgi:hypothetical protein